VFRFPLSLHMDLPDYLFHICSTIQDPSSQKLKWCKAPINALVIRKPGDREVDKVYKEVIELLVSVS